MKNGSAGFYGCECVRICPKLDMKRSLEDMAMIENRFTLSTSNSKLVERIIEDENVAINHMVLAKGDALPEHYSNSNVYMIVVRGAITLGLNGEEERSYPAGSILSIPYNVKMKIYNAAEDILEFFVVKAPSPKYFAPPLPREG